MARQETLFIRGERKMELALREVAYRSIAFGARDKYQIEISAPGVGITRGLELEDIEVIRDWCNEALAAAEAASPALSNSIRVGV